MWARCGGGCRETKGRVRGSHKLQLLLESFSLSWTPLTFYSGASRSWERFNWMYFSDVFGVWVMKKGGGGKEGWIPWWKREEGEGTFHDLQRLIAWLFLGPYWSLTCTGLLLSGLAKALQPLPEPRLQKCSTDSSPVTCSPINSRPAKVAAVLLPLLGRATLTGCTHPGFSNLPH